MVCKSMELSKPMRDLQIRTQPSMGLLLGRLRFAGDSDTEETVCMRCFLGGCGKRTFAPQWVAFGHFVSTIARSSPNATPGG